MAGLLDVGGSLLLRSLVAMPPYLGNVGQLGAGLPAVAVSICRFRSGRGLARGTGGAIKSPCTSQEDMFDIV